jgi:bacterial/archaeal transporter family-2 protein
MSDSIFIALCLFAGVLLAVQPAINYMLGEAAQSPLMGAFFNFAVGTVVMLLVVVFSGHWKTPTGDFFSKTPVWYWSGGLMGALFVTVALVAFPRVGASMTLILFLIGQTVSSALIDHYGFLGLEKRPIGSYQVAGLALMCVGLFVFRK